MIYYVIDTEGDGLAYDCTKLHVLGWTTDGVNYSYTHNYEEMREFLLGDYKERRLVCHNAIRHDLVAVGRILGIELTYRDFVDTLPLSWTINYDRNKHGLESYGVDCGVPKPDIEDWVGLTPEEYAHRVVEDVKIGWYLWKDLKNKLDILYDKNEEDTLRYIDYLNFKMDCAREQEANPVEIDLEAAQNYLTELEQQRDEKYIQLTAVMPKVPIYSEKKYPKKFLNKEGGLSALGARWIAFLQQQKLPSDTCVDVTYISGWNEPNPQSDVQVKDWLTSIGWVPRTFKFDRNKVTGKEKQVPQIRYPKGHSNEGELCEEILELAETNPEVEVLAGLSIIKHRVGFFKGFLDNHKDGKVIAAIEGLTNTLRFQHKKPLANIPGVNKPFGKEIRSCIKAPKGHVQCGADMVSLEDSTKRHFMQPLDPIYVNEMSVDGFDPHLKLLVIGGYITQEDYNFYVEYKQGKHREA